MSFADGFLLGCVTGLACVLVGNVLFWALVYWFVFREPKGGRHG